MAFLQRFLAIFCQLHEQLSQKWGSDSHFEVLNRSESKDRFCIYFFHPKTRPRTFLQWESKAKHCRNVLGRVLG